MKGLNLWQTSFAFVIIIMLQGLAMKMGLGLLVAYTLLGLLAPAAILLVFDRERLWRELGM